MFKKKTVIFCVKPHFNCFTDGMWYRSSGPCVNKYLLLLLLLLKRDVRHKRYWTVLTA